MRCRGHWRHFLRLMLALAAGASVAPAYGQEPVAKAAAEEDRLRPGDLVRLRIWREPDLDGEFPINPDGLVVLPKIGPVQATDAPPTEVKSRILEEYRRYLRNPSIDITFLRRINIQGAVRQPGLYPVDPTMAVADALALAGGVMPGGRPDKVQLRRDGEEVELDVSENTRIGDLPIHSGDQLYVPQESWIVRNQGLVGAILSATISIIITIVNLQANN